MRKATFKGGIHPYDGKALSKDKPTQVIMPKGDLVYPISQHIGAPAIPTVAVGDSVLTGQIIAKADGAVSANVISSVSGKVKAIAKRLTTSGQMVESIIVENDNEYKTIEGYGQKRDYKKLSKEEIRQYVKDAGIVGMGGAGFPTHVKLTPKDDNKIDYVLVNGAECEPYLTSDYRMMLEEPEKIIGGLKVVLSLFPNAKGIIAIEDNKIDAIEKLANLVKGEQRIEVKALKTKYPQGAERKLIYAVTKRKTNSKVLPFEAGVIVNNVDTMIAIYMAVCESTPLIRRIITVTGDAIKNSMNLNVRIGTNYEELVEAAGGFTCEPEKVVSGGPMMGVALFDIRIPVTKTSSALLCMKHDEVKDAEISNCIHCGRCVTACPCRVVPQMLVKAVRCGDYEAFEKLNGMECYDCGSCTYVCPAKINLMQSLKEGKKHVAENRSKTK